MCSEQIEKQAREAYYRVVAVRWEGFDAQAMAAHERALDQATRNYCAAKNQFSARS